MSYNLSKSCSYIMETGVLNIQTPIRLTPFILHILILSWIIPTQEPNTSPWARHCWTPSLVPIEFSAHIYIIMTFTAVIRLFLSWKKIKRTRLFRMIPMMLKIELHIQPLCRGCSDNRLSWWEVLFPIAGETSRVTRNNTIFMLTVGGCMSY